MTDERAASGPDQANPRWYTSVFAKLVVVMVAMAVCLLLLVGGFFWFIVGPNLHHSIDRVMEDYLRTVAAGTPTLVEAQQLHARLGIHLRYDGPAGHWTTAADLPAIAEVEAGKASEWNRLYVPRHYFATRSPDGGEYLFAWTIGSRVSELHALLISLLLAVMIAVVVTAYLVLHRLLAPLRQLNEGVDRIGAGELEVTLPNRTRDEFGRLTEAFNRMAGRIREMIHARDRLLTDVSHELRSPLTRLKVALELSPASTQKTGMAEDIAEMDRMIAELLERERLRTGLGLRVVRQDLLPLLREAAESFALRPPGVRLAAPTGAVLVSIDGERIRIVLRNLLENAAKYALPDSQPVELAVEERANDVVVRVTDDGPGIATEDVERVFEPFYRADPSRSKATGGYGLGLSICQRTMQAHGGDIVLEPRTRARGATFALRFRK